MLFFLAVYFIMDFTLICRHATWTTENYQQINNNNKMFQPIIIYSLKLVTIDNYNLGFSVRHQAIKFTFLTGTSKEKRYKLYEG